MKKWMLILLFLGQFGQAEPVRFEEANFEIDVPAAWKEDEAPPGSLALYRSRDNSKGVLFMSMKFSAADAPAALGKMVSGAKGGAKESNVPISGEHQKVIDGVLFDVHSVTMPGNFSVNMRMAVVGERGYSIQGFSSAGDAAADPELLAVLESFRLLTKPTSPPPGDSSSDGEAFEFGQVVGKWAVIALFAGAVILTLLKASKGSKRSA